MSNYLIAAQNESSLLLEEKLLNRLLLGAFLIAFGLLACWLSLSDETRGNIVGRSIGAVLGAGSMVMGGVSILRRGWVRIDQATRRVEFYGGFRKFRSSARVVAFDEISAVEIRTNRGRHTSYAVDLAISGASDVVVDQTASPNYANSLAESLAQYIGCELHGRAD